MMRSPRGAAYGLALTTALGLAFFGWTRLAPASAQNDPANAPRPAAGQRQFSGPATVAASGDFVYVLRGNTVYHESRRPVARDAKGTSTHKPVEWPTPLQIPSAAL